MSWPSDDDMKKEERRGLFSLLSSIDACSTPTTLQFLFSQTHKQIKEKLAQVRTYCIKAICELSGVTFQPDREQNTANIWQETLFILHLLLILYFEREQKESKKQYSTKNMPSKVILKT